MNPLSSIFGVAVQARNALYHAEFLPAKKLAGPVISVGNLSLGGSGKTPFVLLLAQLLQARGMKLDILTRGYGRSTRGIALVDPAGSPRDFGDEPLLLARRLNLPVVVGEDRYRAGLFAESKFGPQLHLLDDGFQHRRLARDFDIVLLTPEDISDQLLPAGRLREPLSSLQRAHAVVLTGGIPLPIANQNLWRTHRRVELSTNPPRPLAFCGIARPENFIRQLRDAGIEPVAHRFFRDHHPYTRNDIDLLQSLRLQNHADSFITTEKDEINLGILRSALTPLTVATVIMELENPDNVVNTLLRHIQRPQPPGMRESLPSA